jgi:F0F1-type ATP synthase alpha subunit
MDRGDRLVQLFKWPNYTPLAPEIIIYLFYLATTDILLRIGVHEIKKLERRLVLTLQETSAQFFLEEVTELDFPYELMKHFVLLLLTNKIWA